MNIADAFGEMLLLSNVALGPLRFANMVLRSVG